MTMETNTTMTPEERRIKKYINAWCDGKRVQWELAGEWTDCTDIFDLLCQAWAGGGSVKLRIVRGHRKNKFA